MFMLVFSSIATNNVYDVKHFYLKAKHSNFMKYSRNKLPEIIWNNGNFFPSRAKKNIMEQPNTDEKSWIH